MNDPQGVQAVGGVVLVADEELNRVTVYSCGAGLTPTPGGPSPNSKRPALEGNATPTHTPTLTPTVTATATVGTLTVVAAPNISKAGEPVRFLVESPQPATLHLALYTIAGEQVTKRPLRGTRA